MKTSIFCSLYTKITRRWRDTKYKTTGQNTTLKNTKMKDYRQECKNVC